MLLLSLDQLSCSIVIPVGLLVSGKKRYLLDGDNTPKSLDSFSLEENTLGRFLSFSHVSVNLSTNTPGFLMISYTANVGEQAGISDSTNGVRKQAGISDSRSQGAGRYISQHRE